MKYLDLFSGIGGFSLGIKQAGIKINKHYYSEVDKYAQWIYRKQFTESVRLGDVRKIGSEYGKIDLITGGFPCQSFSIAGKRRGFEDTRGTLFFEIERLARLYKPPYMVLENVKGIFSHDGGNTIRVILDKLRRLDYHVQLLLLNTVDFGIPQNRERAFFICTLGDRPRPEISGIRERKTETIKLNELTEKQPQGMRVYDPDGIGVTLAGEAGGVGAKTGLYAIPVLSPDRIEKRQHGRRLEDNGEPSFTLTAQDKHGVLTISGVSITIRSSGRSSCDAKHNWDIINDNSVIRRLTPVECERLQGFPDNWTEYGIDDKGQEIKISDTQRYKTLGNAVTVKVVEEIMKSIKEVI